jgi:predicted membrane protein
MGKNPGIAIGLVLIVGGAVIFLDNLGILPFRAAALFWPLVLLSFGAATLYNSRSATARVWGITALVAGTLPLLDVHMRIRTLWPLVLIAAGASMLIHRTRGQRPGSADRLQELAMFSGVKLKIDSAHFEGGELSSVFGGVEIDLRRAGISSSGAEAVIEANAAFGGIEISVPETWRVSLRGAAVFGAYEDKTLPPRPEPGLQSPLLIVRGGAVFGGIVIKN